MAQIFGVTSNSLLNVVGVLRARYGANAVAVLSNDLKKLRDKRYRRRLRRAELLIAPSVRDMLANLARLNKLATPLLVFDNPIALHGYTDKILDQPRDADPKQLLRQFHYTPLDYARLLKAVERRSNRRHRIQRQNIDVLPQIIQEYTVAGFMDKFNSFMYSITTPANRSEVRNLLVRFVFNKISEEQFNHSLNERGIRLTGKAKHYHQAVVEYINSSKGSVLRTALNEAIKLEDQAAKQKPDARRSIPYKNICEKYSVDRFDLRNLILLYRAL